MDVFIKRMHVLYKKIHSSKNIKWISQAYALWWLVKYSHLDQINFYCRQYLVYSPNTLTSLIHKKKKKERKAMFLKFLKVYEAF